MSSTALATTRDLGLARSLVPPASQTPFSEVPDVLKALVSKSRILLFVDDYGQTRTTLNQTKWLKPEVLKMTNTGYGYAAHQPGSPLLKGGGGFASSAATFFAALPAADFSNASILPYPTAAFMHKFIQQKCTQQKQPGAELLP
ncbi:hypothetical protein AXG93_698s1020 [Marchantia polymorpha subsp. ruderalis]|uniref:Uncharacterized protein n=1 Tax=Marchantia polymorpha subsp. ruderalis TaxID=1480154 RepID=A0A176VFZ7_MARPO|nr:hypothetical protein AXG93_698s1020 [Marchantia polymorpha subsp. ruderalis]